MSDLVKNDEERGDGAVIQQAVQTWEEVVAKTAGDLRELDPGKRDAAWTRCAARDGLRFCNISR